MDIHDLLADLEAAEAETMRLLLELIDEEVGAQPSRQSDARPTPRGHEASPPDQKTERNT